MPASARSGQRSFRGVWLERPKPVTTDDLRILEKADALLKDESRWNRNDDRACDDDRATGRFSLFCALETASTEVLGKYDHRRPALQEVRVVVEEATQQKVRASIDGLQQSSGDAF